MKLYELETAEGKTLVNLGLVKLITLRKTRKGDKFVVRIHFGKNDFITVVRGSEADVKKVFDEFKKL